MQSIKMSEPKKQGVSAFFARSIHFLRYDLWRIRLSDLSKGRALFFKWLRVLMVAIRGFQEDRCSVTASGLTYYSILSVVPLFAMLFGIAKGFGFQRMLEHELIENFRGQELVLAKILEFSQSLLQDTKGGLLAGLGVALLLWTVIKLLGNIEDAFNHIWRVKRPRTWARRLSDYLSIALVCPLTLIISGGLTVFLTGQVTGLTENLAFSKMIGPVLFFLLKLLPYVLIWLLFSFIYMVMPNTKVTFKSAFFAAVTAGSVYQVVQWGYLEFQVGVARQNAIYGSFAALPLFLIWVQLSWLIVLLGAEIAWAVDNSDSYELAPDETKLSSFDCKLLALSVAHVVVKTFAKGEPPLSAAGIAARLKLPSRLVQQTINRLRTSGIFTETLSDTPEETAYQPARDIEFFTIGFVLNRLEKNGAGNLLMQPSEEVNRLTETLETFHENIERSTANKLLKDI